MSTVLPRGTERAGNADSAGARLPVGAGVSSSWLLAIVGFAAMYLPLYWWAAQTIWETEEQGHGAIILAVMVWLFWSLRGEMARLPTRPSPALGWPVLVLGLCVYIVGRAFQISILEFASQPLVVAGALLLLKGTPALRC